MCPLCSCPLLCSLWHVLFFYCISLSTHPSFFFPWPRTFFSFKKKRTHTWSRPMVHGQDVLSDAPPTNGLKACHRECTCPFPPLLELWTRSRSHTHTHAHAHAHADRCINILHFLMGVPCRILMSRGQIWVVRDTKGEKEEEKKSRRPSGDTPRRS